MSEDDKILDIDSEGSTYTAEDQVEEKPQDNVESVVKVDEGEKKETPENSKPQYQTSVLSESEYKTLKSTLATIASLKGNLGDNPNSQTAVQHVKLLEVSIWDELVKKFGFPTTEAAQQAGYTFGLRQLHVVECRKKT